MVITARPEPLNDTLSNEDITQLDKDEAALGTDDGEYQFLWGLVSEVPLKDTHFPNEDGEYSLVYLKAETNDEKEVGFEKYILIPNLSNTVLRNDVVFEIVNTDATNTEIGRGHVCKIPLDSAIKFRQVELKDGGFLLSAPIDISELGIKDKYEALKSNSPQAIAMIRSIFRI